jgi:hypothetical protein
VVNEYAHTHAGDCERETNSAIKLTVGGQRLGCLNERDQPTNHSEKVQTDQPDFGCIAVRPLEDIYVRVAVGKLKIRARRVGRPRMINIHTANSRVLRFAFKKKEELLFSPVIELIVH